MSSKRLLRIIRAPFVCVLVFLIYCLGCLCYDKRYLRGRYFDRKHFTVGWRWILRYWFGQKVMRKNGHVPWPVPPHTLVACPQNVIFDVDDMQNFHTVGSYFQGIDATITIGKGCAIAAGVGMITANHQIGKIEKHESGKPIVLGEGCWIGMNAVILPGVVLGPNTVVGAGSVVTHSFPEGNCILVGNPAQKLREISKGEDDEKS